MKYALKATAIGLVPLAGLLALFLSGYLWVTVIAVVALILAFAMGDSILASKKEADEEEEWF